MSNANHTAADFVPSAEELDRLMAWTLEEEKTAPPSGPWIPDHSEEQARNLVLLATYSEEDMDRAAADHDARRDHEEARHPGE